MKLKIYLRYLRVTETLAARVIIRKNIQENFMCKQAFHKDRPSNCALGGHLSELIAGRPWQSDKTAEPHGRIKIDKVGRPYLTVHG